MKKIVITVVGKDKVELLQRYVAILLITASLFLDISQTIVQDFLI